MRFTCPQCKAVHEIDYDLKKCIGCGQKVDFKINKKRIAISEQVEPEKEEVKKRRGRPRKSF